MNKYSYKNLNVYQDAKSLVVDVYKLLKLFPAEEKYALCDQIRRAVISITSNIAEGMNRMSDKEKAHFIGVAYASMMEVDSQLEVSVELGYLTPELYNTLEEKIDCIARQLSALRAKYAGGVERRA
jgi:four helix bundle protein